MTAVVPERLLAALSDRYAIERELGRGGMATVYLARDVRHARQVAIKVLHPELAAVLGAERFLAEIITTANLQHPHILPLFDSGSADGQLFYVMPYVEGETLRARLDRETQLPIGDALGLAREVADAPQYAHDHGVIHRDIKPENILLPEWSSDGRTVYFARLNARFNASRRQADVVRVPAQGGAEPVAVLQRDNQIYEFQVSADGRRILWREDVATGVRDVVSAALATPDSARAERASRFDERGIALSPDGEWYVYTSDETGTSEIYLSRLGSTGARWPVSRGGGTEPRWTRNGEIFFRRGDTVFVTRPTLGEEPRVAPAQTLFVDAFLASGHEPLWDVSPDGERFALVHDRSGTTGGSGYFELVMNWRTRWMGAP